IGGSGFAADERIELQVVHTPGTDGSNADPQNEPWQVYADGAGNFCATWLVNDPDAIGASYILMAHGLDSGFTAQTTFTDSRAIGAVTLNGGASVTVLPGANISAVVNVTTDGSGSSARWR